MKGWSLLCHVGSPIRRQLMLPKVSRHAHQCSLRPPLMADVAQTITICARMGTAAAKMESVVPAGTFVKRGASSITATAGRTQLRARLKHSPIRTRRPLFLSFLSCTMTNLRSYCLLSLSFMASKSKSRSAGKCVTMSYAAC